MGKRSAAKKIVEVRSRVSYLAKHSHDCYYCKGNCYKGIAPHLSQLHKWLLQAESLEAAALDRELLWIFGKSNAAFYGAGGRKRRRVEEGSHSSSSGSSNSCSDSDPGSLQSFDSVSTQNSSPRARRKGNRLAASSSCRNGNETDEFMSDETADSELDGLTIDNMQATGQLQSDCSNHVHHEAAVPNFAIAHEAYATDSAIKTSVSYDRIMIPAPGFEGSFCSTC